MLESVARSVLLGALLTGSLQAQQSRLFPFQLPWDDASPTVTDLSGLNEKPAGASGPVRVGADGHLYAGGRRIRFFGVNLTYRSAFPDHEDAERIARRLAKFGVNVVRFHLMDAEWGGQVLFDSSKPGTRDLSPTALDNLDYFIAELKKNGIFANLNLLTGRNFRENDGVNPAIESMQWKEKQTPAFFDPTMIVLQKEFATQLLQRINPYTGLSYTEDPAIAFVEVVNEHGLMHAWHSGMIDDLPAFFSSQLQSSWNRFVSENYGSQDRLLEAWTISSPQGPQLLRNGNFASGLQYWSVEQHSGARAGASISAAGPGGSQALRIAVEVPGSANWHVQLNQGGLPAEAGTVYRVSFWARCDRSKTISVQVEQAHDPWQGLGFDRRVDLTPAWQRFDFTFSLSSSDPNARLNFRDMNDQLATYWFANLSLSAGGTLGTFPDEHLESGTIRVFTRAQIGERNSRARRDWMEFLWETEKSYWLEMRDHLKTSLGIQALLAGTVVGTSTPNLMNLFDVIDSHAYWQHPSFLVSWGSPWWFRNSSMVGESDGGTITGLAAKRIRGKPFSVSEYNHPFPLSFGAEAFPLLAAYGALQDWDALYGYTYADGKMEWAVDRQTGYFDLQRSPERMIGIAHAAALFRRADVSPALQEIVVELDREHEIALLPTAGSWRLVDAQDVGLPLPSALVHRTALVTDEKDLPASALSPDDVDLPRDGHFVSDTGQLDWNSGARLLSIQSPRSQALIGYLEGAEEALELGPFRLADVDSLQGWAAFLATEMQSTAEHRRFLVSALGLVQNQGQEWRFSPSNQPAPFPPPADVDLTLGSWGTAPLIAEGISADLTVPFPRDQVQVFALDGTGSRSTEVPTEPSGAGTLVALSSDYRTLWYEIVLPPLSSRSVVPGFHAKTGEFVGLAISNPSISPATVRILRHTGPSTVSPSSLFETVLAPKTQVAKLLDEFFETSPPADSGWLDVASDNPAVATFVQFGDYHLRHLDGVGATSGRGNPLYLTRLGRHFRGQPAMTRVSVVNHSEEELELVLVLLAPQQGPSGTVAPLLEVERILVILQPGEFLQQGAEALFHALRDDAILELVSEDSGALSASQTTDLVAQDSLFALPGQTAATRSFLYSPQLASIPGSLSSSALLVNVAREPRTLTLRGFSDSGEPFGSPVSIEMPARSVYQADVSQLFPPIPPEGLIGTLEVEVEPPGGVLGNLVFGTVDLSYAAACPLEQETFVRAVFSHVANLPGLFFTGLALFNPSLSPAAVRVQVFAQDGRLRGSRELSLGARSRRSDTLASLVPETEEQVGGFILLESDSPILAQELFGTNQLTLLSAVPPWLLE